MTYSAIEPAFEAVLRRRLSYLSADEALLPDASLKELGLDSMQAVELIFDLEDELGVVLPDEAMTAQTFATPASLEAALAAARNQITAGTS
jgi:acyl carrier protein